MRRTALGTLIVALVGLSSAARAADAPVTFTKDVAPILYKSCIECHRPTMFAPMSLVTFDDARPWARSIKQRVVSRAMPPWGADPAHGTFKNDPRLSQAEIDTIAKWVDDGAQIMSSSCMRYVKEFAPYRTSTTELGALRFASITTPKSWERYGIHALEGIYPILGPGFLSARNTGSGPAVA